MIHLWCSKSFCLRWFSYVFSDCCGEPASGRVDLWRVVLAGRPSWLLLHVLTVKCLDLSNLDHISYSSVSTFPSSSLYSPLHHWHPIGLRVFLKAVCGSYLLDQGLTAEQWISRHDLANSICLPKEPEWGCNVAPRMRRNLMSVPLRKKVGWVRHRVIINIHIITILQSS